MPDLHATYKIINKRLSGQRNAIALEPFRQKRLHRRRPTAQGTDLAVEERQRSDCRQPPRRRRADAFDATSSPSAAISDPTGGETDYHRSEEIR